MNNAKISVCVSYLDLDEEFIATEEDNIIDHIINLESCDQIIGYNSYAFDLKILGNYIPIKQYWKKHFDIFRYLYLERGIRPKLSDITLPTLQETKMNLNMTPAEAYKRGEISKLMSYCKKDVRLTNLLWEFGYTNKYLYVLDSAGHKEKVEVDFK